LRPIVYPLRLRSLSAVLGTALLAIFDTEGILGAADDVVTHAREILYTASADEDHRVFLEIMTYAGNIGRNLYPVSKPNTSYLAESRIRLLRGNGHNTGANATALGTPD